jgi:hypothetical protein
MRANDIITVTAILGLSFLAQALFVSRLGAEMGMPAAAGLHALQMMTNYPEPVLPPEVPPTWLVSP